MTKTTAIIPADQRASLWRSFVEQAATDGLTMTRGGAVIEVAPAYKPHEWFSPTAQEAYRVSTGRLAVAE